MKFQDWLKTHKPEAGIAAAGMVVALVLYQRSKSNAAGTTGTNATTQSYAMPATTANTTGTDAYSGIESQVLGLQQAFLATQVGAHGGMAGTQGTPPAATPAAPATNNGFGQTTIGGQVYDILGNVTNGNFNGYNVGGGEPVYYNSGGSLLTNIGTDQISGLPAGTQVLTVAQAGQQGQISATPVSGEHIGK